MAVVLSLVEKYEVTFRRLRARPRGVTWTPEGHSNMDRGNQSTMRTPIQVGEGGSVADLVLAKKKLLAFSRFVIVDLFCVRDSVLFVGAPRCPASLHVSTTCRANHHRPSIEAIFCKRYGVTVRALVM